MTEYVSMKDVFNQHRVVHEPMFSIGKLKLQHLRHADNLAISERIFKEKPEFKVLAEELSVIYEQIEAYGEDKIPADRLARVKELCKLLAPLVSMLAIPCFVEPKINSMEELEAIGDVLAPQEWVKLQALLKTLSAPLSAKEINTAFISQCKAFGIPLANDLTAENITFNQAQVMDATLRAEAKASKTAIQELKDGVE